MQWSDVRAVIEPLRREAFGLARALSQRFNETNCWSRALSSSSEVFRRESSLCLAEETVTACIILVTIRSKILGPTVQYFPTASAKMIPSFACAF